MNEKEREVLHTLCNGDITFLEASETEMETLSHIIIIN